MIRNMAAGDVDALTAIEVACFAAGYADKMMTRADFAEVLTDPHAALFCAVEGGEVAGYAFLLLEDGAANFDSLAVSPAHVSGLVEQLRRAGTVELPVPGIGLLHDPSMRLHVLPAGPEVSGAKPGEA